MLRFFVLLVLNLLQLLKFPEIKNITTSNLYKHINYNTYS